MTRRRLALPPLHPGQIDIEEDPARFKLIVAGRRFGKTRWATRACIRVASGDRWWKPEDKSPGRAWWVAPIYKTTHEGWEPLVYIARQIPGSRIELAERRVILPNGGRVEIRSADRPENLVGAGLDLAVLDEAGSMKLQAWKESVRPTLSDRIGAAILIGTPKGFNWLYDLWAEVPERRSWARWRKPSWENPLLQPDELADARAELGTILYDQEYGAEFVDVSGGIFHPPFPTFRTITAETDSDFGYRWLVEGSVVDPADCRRFVVIDPAVSTKESADFTVIAACAITPAHQLLVLEIVREHMEGPTIIPAAEKVMRRHTARELLVESVAFQLTLFQEARRRGLPTRRLKADRDKLSRALPLAARFEAHTVFFNENAPWIGELERELIAFPAGAHDDQVDALAYAAAEVGRSREWAAY